ncbi:MAG: hypothetical protein IJB21_00780 [Bacilli bacterium]|nr:hypothetical protein [Bacilli bacterium]
MKNRKIISIFSFIFSVLSLIVGILILPSVTDFGLVVLQYIIAALILSYVFIILLYKAIKRTEVIQILAIIEMVLDIVIAITLILNFKLNFIVFNELFYVIMLVLFIHAFFSIISGFYINRKVKSGYPIYLLLIDVCLIIFTTIGFLKPILDNNALIIITSCICFLCCILGTTYGLIILKNRKNKELVN